jgi:hypothetical protein
VRFLEKRRLVCDVRAAQEFQTILTFICFLERDLQLGLEFSA